MRILLVEDNPGDARLCRELLAESFAAPFTLLHVPTLNEAIEECGREEPHVALVDLSLPDARGLAIVVALKERLPQLPVVVLSGLADEAVALEAIHIGAQDYLVKGDCDGSTMVRTIRYAIERKRIQLQLIAAKERAEAASRTKSEFLANVSHELRTPLNAIIGFSEILQSDVPGIESRRAEYARNIHESGIHLLAIINDILDLSKLEAGKLGLDEVDVDVPSLIEGCMRIIGERADKAGLSLATNLADRLPAIRGDERKLKQVLLNLLSNAVKFTPPGGSVTIEATAPGTEVAIVVRDTGIGIAPEDMPRVLAPFVQVEGAFSRRYDGTGLGLSLAKSLTEMHGGTLSLDSTPGRGTAVTVRVPASIRAGQAAA